MVFDLGSIQLTLSPALKTLLTASKRVFHISAPCSVDFLNLVQQENLTTSSLRLSSYGEGVVESIVAALGDVTSLDVRHCGFLSEQEAASIATISPYLKSFRVPYVGQIRPILDHCDLTNIFSINGGYFLPWLTEQTESELLCDLRRAPVPDSCTLAVGDKWFYLTGLVVLSIHLLEDVEQLSAYFEYLEFFEMEDCHSQFLIGLLAAKCTRLTSLSLRGTHLPMLYCTQITDVIKNYLARC